MLLVVRSTRGEATYGGVGVVAFLFSFRPTLRRGKRAADTQNHTALQRACNRNTRRQVGILNSSYTYIIMYVYVYNRSYRGDHLVAIICMV